MSERTPPLAGTDRTVLGLAGRWDQAVTELSKHRVGVTALGRVEIGAQAMAGLGAGRELTYWVDHHRPWLVIDALGAGCDPVAVARVAGFSHPADLRAWLRSWANQQHRAGVLDDTRHSQVLALADTLQRGAGS